MPFQNPQFGDTSLTKFACRLGDLNDRLTVVKLGCLLIAVTSLCALEAHAQACTITTVQDTTRLVYPPLARAAHLQGAVVLMTIFQLDGKVGGITSISGPEWLKGASAAYVRGLKTNTSPDPRQCSMVVTFKLQDGPLSRPTDLLAFVQSLRRIDPQHVVLSGKDVCAETKPTTPAESH